MLDPKALYLSCLLLSFSTTACSRSGGPPKGPLEPVPSTKLPAIGYSGTWEERHVWPDGSVKKVGTWRVVVHGERFRVERVSEGARSVELYPGGAKIFSGIYQEGADEERLQKIRFWAKKPSSRKVGSQVICGAATRDFDVGRGLRASLHYEHDIVLRREEYIARPGNAAELFKALEKDEAGDYSSFGKRVIECTSIEWNAPNDSAFEVPKPR